MKDDDNQTLVGEKKGLSVLNGTVAVVRKSGLVHKRIHNPFGCLADGGDFCCVVLNNTVSGRTTARRPN